VLIVGETGLNATVRNGRDRELHCSESAGTEALVLCFDAICCAVRLLQNTLALDPLLFAIHACFDTGGGARIFPRHFAERGAGGLFLLQRGERLPKPQQRVGRLRRLVVFAGDVEEDLGGVAILLALEQAFTQPILRIPEQGIAGIFFREIAHGLFGERVILALHVADPEIVLVPRRVRRRQDR